MNVKVKYILPLAIVIFFISVVGVNAQMENLRADYDSKLATYDQAKTDYLKLKNLSSTDSQRVEGARKVLVTSLDSVNAYMNMFKSKLDSIKPAEGEGSIGNLSDKYIQLTGLDRKIQDAKSLDDLKKCLTDTKTFWQEVVDSCKYVQSRYMLFQTNEAYLKLNQVATELDSFVDSEELKNAKNSLTSSNTEFTNYYSQMLKKSQSDMNSSYADLQSNVTKYSKVLGDTEASLAKVIQKASE
ncbi:MAG: hypothetical protein WCO33_02250 [bacterium]